MYVQADHVSIIVMNVLGNKEQPGNYQSEFSCGTSMT